MKHFIAVALLATLFSPGVLAVWGAQSEFNKIEKALPTQPDVSFEVDKIENALAAPPYVPDELQNLATTFLDHTLPKLLADDERLAHQLGFGGSMSNPVMIDRALAIMVIRREQILNLIEKEKVKPSDWVNLINNRNNWLEDKAEHLVPKRIVFVLKVHDSAYEAGDTWSSVTMEQSDDGSSWRIIQVGAPKLSRAMNQFADAGVNQFLLWIPDLNRHYLGKIQNHFITLTVLFRDRLLKSEPGKDQRITQEYLANLKRLYQELDLPKKLHSKTDKTQTPTQQKKLPDQSNKGQPPVRAQ